MFHCSCVAGGWWKVKNIEEMTGSIAIEFGNQMYVKALDNGLFTLGTLHREGKLNGIEWKHFIPHKKYIPLVQCIMLVYACCFWTLPVRDYIVWVISTGKN